MTKRSLSRLFAALFLFTWATFAVWLGVVAEREHAPVGAIVCFLLAALAAGFALRELTAFLRRRGM